MKLRIIKLIGILSKLSLLPVCNAFDPINQDYTSNATKNMYFLLHYWCHSLTNGDVTDLLFCLSSDRVIIMLPILQFLHLLVSALQQQHLATITLSLITV